MEMSFKVNALMTVERKASYYQCLTNFSLEPLKSERQIGGSLEGEIRQWNWQEGSNRPGSQDEQSNRAALNRLELRFQTSGHGSRLTKSYVETRKLGTAWRWVKLVVPNYPILKSKLGLSGNCDLNFTIYSSLRKSWNEDRTSPWKLWWKRAHHPLLRTCAETLHNGASCM